MSTLQERIYNGQWDEIIKRDFLNDFRNVTLTPEFIIDGVAKNNSEYFKRPEMLKRVVSRMITQAITLTGPQWVIFTREITAHSRFGDVQVALQLFRSLINPAGKGIGFYDIFKDLELVDEIAAANKNFWTRLNSLSIADDINAMSKTDMETVVESLTICNLIQANVIQAINFKKFYPDIKDLFNFIGSMIIDRGEVHYYADYTLVEFDVLPKKHFNDNLLIDFITRRPGQPISDEMIDYISSSTRMGWHAMLKNMDTRQITEHINKIDIYALAGSNAIDLDFIIKHKGDNRRDLSEYRFFTDEEVLKYPFFVEPTTYIAKYPKMYISRESWKAINVEWGTRRQYNAKLVSFDDIIGSMLLTAFTAKNVRYLRDQTNASTRDVMRAIDTRSTFIDGPIKSMMGFVKKYIV